MGMSTDSTRRTAVALTGLVPNRTRIGVRTGVIGANRDCTLRKDGAGSLQAISTGKAIRTNILALSTALGVATPVTNA